MTVQAINPAPVLLSSPLVNTNGQFQFLLPGRAGDSYRIEASTDLSTWSALATNTLTGLSMLCVDPAGASNATYRFYRAIWRT